MRICSVEKAGKSMGESNASARLSVSFVVSLDGGISGAYLRPAGGRGAVRDCGG